MHVLSDVHSKRTRNPEKSFGRQRCHDRGRQFQRGRQNHARDISLAFRQRCSGRHICCDVLISAHQRQLRYAVRACVRAFLLTSPPACQNSKALNGLLKGELGFQGYTMSDWLATHSGVAPANAGLDMNMPGGIIFPNPTPSFWGDNITIAVNNGSLSGERLDDMVRRIMTPYFQLGQDVGFPPIDGHTPDLGFFGASGYAHDFMLGPNVDVRSQHHTKLIRDLGAAGTVLLKNINGALPLRIPKTIGVFGNDAADLTRGQYSLATMGPNLMDGDYDIGTLAVGGGSGTGRFPYVVSPLEAIKTRGQSQGAIVEYITDNEYIVGGGLASLGSLPPEVCIVFLKSWASEGDDRTTLTAEWNSTAVVDRTAAICNNTVVVLHGAAPNTMPWRNNPNVTAILVAHMPGQESGNAVADVLWGDVNPSGRLPYTIADNEADYARNLINSTELATTTDPDAWQADFIEGNLIDYKAFDAHNKSVAFEFGFGLSYTFFDISCLQIEVGASNVSRMPDPTAPIQPGGNAELWDTLATIRATVTNTGSVAGATVPQLYLSYPPEANAPARSLRGFEKMRLEARASGTVQFSLTRRDLSYWETTAQAWTLPAGRIGVQVGFSSRKLPLEGGFTVPLLAPTG